MKELRHRATMNARNVLFLKHHSKKMQKLLLAGTIWFNLVSYQLYAQPSDLNSLLSTHSFAIESKNGSFEGPGLDYLLDEASKCQFVLFGERHFTREIPLFIEFLLPQLFSNGFDQLAIETGPIGASHMARNFISKKNLPNPTNGIPFYVTKEETDLVRTFLELSGSDSSLWGIDIEYIFGVRAALYEVKNKGLTGYEISLMDVLEKKVDTAFQNFMTTGRYSQLPIFKEEIRSKLREVGSVSTNKEIQWIVDKVLSDAEVHLSRDGYFKNTRRIKMMKENFMNKFFSIKDQTGEYPRVIVKMGSNHTQRGLNDQYFYDVGNFISELSESIGTSSLHVPLYQVKSKTIWWTPENRQSGNLEMPSKPFEYTFPPILNEISSIKAWTLYDLRPLRELIWRQKWVEDVNRLEWITTISDEFRKIVEAHDLVIIIPETTPQATLKN